MRCNDSCVQHRYRTINHDNDTAQERVECEEHGNVMFIFDELIPGEKYLHYSPPTKQSSEDGER